jgi:hypothetical protein
MADDVIVAAIKEIASVLSGMSGVEQAPQFPPENVNDPPMVVTKLISTDVSYSATYSRTTSVVWADVFLARASLPHAEEMALPYVYRTIAATAAEMTLNDKATHWILTRVEGPMGLTYGNEDYYGIRCTFDLKIVYDDTLTVTA